MKRSIILSFLIAAVILGCKAQQNTSGYTYDDVYSNRSDKTKITTSGVSGSNSADTLKKKKVASSTSKIDYSNSSNSVKLKKTTANDSGQTYSTDYYPSSTNDSTTTSGGSAPTTSPYVDNTWCYPYCGPAFSFGLGFGWGDFGFGYGYPWYSPYYDWGYPYYGWGYPYGYWGNPYWGYNGHHHHGDWDWGHEYFRDRYYGQRRGVSSPNGIRHVGTSTTSTKVGPTQTAARRVNPGYVNRTGRPVVNNLPADRQHYNYTRANTQANTRAVRTNPGNKINSSRNYVQGQQQTPRYVRPQNQQTSRSNAQAYSSPAYKQAKSSQEYINPRSQQGRPAGVGQNTNRTGNANYQAPSGRRYPSTNYNRGNSRIYSNPSGGYRGYSSPSRSYSSPGRMGGGSGFSGGGSHPSGGGGGHSSGGSGGGGHSGGGGRR